jgi:hypothetical protein
MNALIHLFIAYLVSSLLGAANLPATELAASPTYNGWDFLVFGFHATECCTLVPMPQSKLVNIVSGGSIRGHASILADVAARCQP